MIWGYPHFRKPQCDYVFIQLFPHIFVWGSCFWFCIPPLLLLRLLRLLVLHLSTFANHHLSHTIFHTHLGQPPSFTHNLSSMTHILVTHHLSHTFFSHTICHTHTSFSHTSLSHTIFHKHLSHTPSFTHLCHKPFVTHHLSHFIFHKHLSHTIFRTHLCHTPSVTHNLSPTSLSTTICHTNLCQPPSFTPRHFARQAWRLVTSTFDFAWQAWQAWQAWRLVTSTFVSHGRRGTWSHSPLFWVASMALMALGWLWRVALCVAGVALGDIHLRFAWQARHLVTSTFVSPGRRGTYGTGLALVARLSRFLVAGHFAWHAWHLWHWAGSGGALGPVLVAGHFAWQAWRLVASTFLSRGRRGTWSHHVTSTFVLRGRLGPYGPGLALVSHALHRFAWQAWRLWHWAGAGGALGLVWSPVTPRHFAWQAWLGDIHLPFAKQAWHLVTSTSSFCVAGVALMALGWLWWRAWAGFGPRWRRGTLRGRRGAW